MSTKETSVVAPKEVRRFVESFVYVPKEIREKIVAALELCVWDGGSTKKYDEGESSINACFIWGENYVRLTRYIGNSAVDAALVVCFDPSREFEFPPTRFIYYFKDGKLSNGEQRLHMRSLPGMYPIDNMFALLGVGS